MWCGHCPDGALVAPCCLFASAIVAWAITALGALVFRAGGNEPIETQHALTIGFIACVLVVVVHVAPDGVALALAAAMAAHAALIAIVVTADYALGDQRAAPAPLRRERL